MMLKIGKILSLQQCGIWFSISQEANKPLDPVVWTPILEVNKVLGKLVHRVASIHEELQCDLPKLFLPLNPPPSKPSSWKTNGIGGGVHS
jgi:hypothetical protein